MNRTEAVLFDSLSFWPAQVRRENHARAMFGRVIDRRQRRANARIVVNSAVFDGNVEIDSNEDAFAGKFQIPDGELGHRYLHQMVSLPSVSLQHAMLKTIKRAGQARLPDCRFPALSLFRQVPRNRLLIRSV